jgi:two-component system response regulator RegX3
MATGFRAAETGKEPPLNATILVVEDSTEMADLVELYLRKEGLEVLKSSDGEAGWNLFQNSSIDLILLDLNLPSLDGFEFLQRLRKVSDVPVIIVSARDQDEDMILGLGLGADDFVVKPFSPRVLAARCRAVLGRVSAPRPITGSAVSFGPVQFHVQARVLISHDEKVPLSPREYELLKYLVEHPGIPYSSEELYAKVWGQEFGDTSVVGVYLMRLRKKIEPDVATPRFLQTVRGFGYCYQP